LKEKKRWGKDGEKEVNGERKEFKEGG